jgi:hypothetical protein
VKGDAFVRWFAQQGVDDRALDGMSVDGCEEVAFDPPDRALACVTTEPVTVDPSLGASGPTQIDTSLIVLCVHDRRLVKLAAVPIGVASSEFGELLFRARYAFDLATRSLDVVVDPEDCRAAPARLAKYWEPKLAEARKSDQKHVLVRAIDLERQKGASRITAICAAAGRHALRAP